MESVEGAAGEEEKFVTSEDVFDHIQGEGADVPKKRRTGSALREDRCLQQEKEANKRKLPIVVQIPESPGKDISKKGQMLALGGRTAKKS